MTAKFFDGLRDGMEASLVVGVIIAYLVRTRRRRSERWVWIGAAVAVGVSQVVGAAVVFTSSTLPERTEPTVNGVASIISMVFVTWMILWMKRAAQLLRRELREDRERAVAMGAGALFAVAFFAVGRESLEEALSLWPTIKNASSISAPIGALAGVAMAVLLGYWLYHYSFRLSLAKFFHVSGLALIVVTAGVLAAGLHELQEAGWIAGKDVLAFDVSVRVPESSWYGALLKGTVNFTAQTTWLQLGAWITYLIVALTVFLLPPSRRHRTGSTATAPAQAA
jgi:high-affinity iron transporter